MSKRELYTNAYRYETDDPQEPTPQPGPSDASELTPEPGPSEPNDPSNNAEEATFKQRYGDLRRHTQQLERELRTKITELESKIQNAPTASAPNIPTTPEEIEAWRQEYPQAYALVWNMSRQIADAEVSKRLAEFEEKLQPALNREQELLKEKAILVLSKRHPDYREIQASDDFHAWAQTQPDEIQDWLYSNTTDGEKAAKAIDLYKLDRNLIGKPTKSSQAASIEASLAVRTGKGAVPVPNADGKRVFKESEVIRLRPEEYEELEEEIEDAMRDGRFVYDVKTQAA